MPNETLIVEIENMLSEVVKLGGENERSQIVPNLTVQNANPTGLDGWLIISDDRDGDNILARKVGSVVYSDNDLVNVMFLEGTEPIAFQQGSGSSNSNIWEIVPSTSTDIYYDKGKVGIGTTTIPHGGVGSSKLAIEGTNASADGPHVQFTTPTDDYPVMQFWAFRHDQMALNFDAYYDGSNRSSDAGSNFQIIKVLDVLQIRYDSGIAAGSVISWNSGIVLQSDGDVGIGTATPAAKLEVNADTTNRDALVIQSTDDDDTNKMLSIQLSDGTEFLSVDVSQAALPTGLTIDTRGVATSARALPLTVIFDDNDTNPLVGLSGMVFANRNTTDGNLASIIFATETSTGVAPAFGALECIFTDHLNTNKEADVIITSMRANSLVEQLRVRSDGNLLLGVDTSLGDGKIHAYDSISGFKLWEYDGLDATVRTVIANGAGDVLYRVTTTYVMRDSSGNATSGAVGVSNSASANLVIGGNTVRLRVNADGSCDIARTAGTDTIKVAITLRWL